VGLRSLAELIDVDRPAWPVVMGLVASATVDVQVLDLPSPRNGQDTLVNLQVTAGSFLGAIALHCGGLLIDHGWLRLLGGGTSGLPDLASANGLPAPDLQPPGHLVVGYDVLGGSFAVNGGDLPGRSGEICYFGPDTLDWAPLGLSGHSALLQWALAGGLAETFADLRWKGWHDESASGPGHGIRVYPPLWSEQARPLENTTRRRASLAELVRFHQDQAHQFAELPDGSPVSIRVKDQPR